MEGYLVSLLLELLQEGRVLHRLLALSSDIVDVLLVADHATHIVVQRGSGLSTLGGLHIIDK